MYCIIPCSVYLVIAIVCLWSENPHCTVKCNNICRRINHVKEEAKPKPMENTIGQINSWCVFYLLIFTAFISSFLYYCFLVVWRKMLGWEGSNFGRGQSASSKLLQDSCKCSVASSCGIFYINWVPAISFVSVSGFWKFTSFPGTSDLISWAVLNPSFV